MTKTLTEQWREGTLEQRYYYVKYFGNGQKPFVGIELKNFLLDLVKVKDRDKIEVLAPVPSYDEWQAELDSNNELLNVQKRLEKRLVSKTDESFGNTEQLERLQEQLERLQKQISDANDVILQISEEPKLVPINRFNADFYLEKWGVK